MSSILPPQVYDNHILYPLFFHSLILLFFNLFHHHYQILSLTFLYSRWISRHIRYHRISRKAHLLFYNFPEINNSRVDFALSPWLRSYELFLVFVFQNSNPRFPPIFHNAHKRKNNFFHNGERRHDISISRTHIIFVHAPKLWLARKLRNHVISKGFSFF